MIKLPKDTSAPLVASSELVCDFFQFQVESVCSVGSVVTKVLVVETEAKTETAGFETEAKDEAVASETEAD